MGNGRKKCEEKGKIEEEKSEEREEGSKEGEKGKGKRKKLKKKSRLCQGSNLGEVKKRGRGNIEDDKKKKWQQ